MQDVLGRRLQGAHGARTEQLVYGTAVNSELLYSVTVRQLEHQQLVSSLLTSCRRGLTSPYIALEIIIFPPVTSLCLILLIAPHVPHSPHSCMRDSPEVPYNPHHTGTSHILSQGFVRYEGLLTCQTWGSPHISDLGVSSHVRPGGLLTCQTWGSPHIHRSSICLLSSHGPSIS